MKPRAAKLKRDLFAEADQGIQILDPAKLNRLAGEKLQTLADQVRAEGWKWVEVQPEIEHAALGRMRRIPAPLAELPAKQQNTLEKLFEKSEALDAQLSGDDEEANQAVYAQIDEIGKAIDAIELNPQAGISRRHHSYLWRGDRHQPVRGTLLYLRPHPQGRRTEPAVIQSIQQFQLYAHEQHS